MLSLFYYSLTVGSVKFVCAVHFASIPAVTSVDFLAFKPRVEGDQKPTFPWFWNVLDLNRSHWLNARNWDIWFTVNSLAKTNRLGLRLDTTINSLMGSRNSSRGCCKSDTVGWRCGYWFLQTFRWPCTRAGYRSCNRIFRSIWGDSSVYG